MTINYINKLDSMNLKDLYSHLQRKFKLHTISGMDINGNCFYAFSDIRIMNRKFLYVPDTGYGVSDHDALLNLFSKYMSNRLLLRRRTNRGELYFTTKLRKEIKNYIKKEYKCV